MSFTDPSDILKGEGKRHVIDFHHIPTGKSVEFKAWLTDFSDRFESEWSSEPTYGRMDPIQTFKHTTRVIDLAWDVVAASEAEAINNMALCQSLFRMLYPVFGGDRGRTLQAPPLMKLKFVNLIQDSSRASPDYPTTAEEAGLTGTVSGFSYSPDLDSGFFDKGTGVVYPQTIKLECSFTVLHTHDLGYDTTGKWQGADGFPYRGTGKSGQTSSLGRDSVSEAEEQEALDESPLEPLSTEVPLTNTSGDTDDAALRALEAAMEKLVRDRGNK